MHDTKLIQIKVRENRIREINEVKDKIKPLRMSDMIRRSIGIVHSVTKYVEKGDKIIIESKNGERTEFIITGME